MAKTYQMKKFILITFLILLFMFIGVNKDNSLITKETNQTEVDSFVLDSLDFDPECTVGMGDPNPAPLVIDPPPIKAKK